MSDHEIDKLRAEKKYFGLRFVSDLEIRYRIGIVRDELYHWKIRLQRPRPR